MNSSRNKYQPLRDRGKKNSSFSSDELFLDLVTGSTCPIQNVPYNQNLAMASFEVVYHAVYLPSLFLGITCNSSHLLPGQITLSVKTSPKLCRFLFFLDIKTKTKTYINPKNISNQYKKYSYTIYVILTYFAK